MTRTDRRTFIPPIIADGSALSAIRAGGAKFEDWALTIARGNKRDTTKIDEMEHMQYSFRVSQTTSALPCSESTIRIRAVISPHRNPPCC